MIEKQSFIPIYKQVAGYLRERITNNTLKPLTRLPSERDLATELGVNRITLRKALEILNYEGLIAREIGKGTYVTETRDSASAKRKNLCMVLSWGTVENITEDYFNLSIIKGIRKSLPDYCNFHLLTREKGMNYIDLYHHHNLDGMIISGPPKKDTQELIKLGKIGIPVMIIGKFHNSKLNYLFYDNTNCTISAIEYLIKLGHRNIAYISGSQDYSSSILRLEGYKLSLKKHRMKYNEKLVVYSTDREDYKETGYRGANTLLELNPAPTAIVCYDHHMVVGTMRAIKEKELNIPYDISILGLDDHPFMEYTDPSVTGIKLPLEEIGKIAIEELTRRLVVKDKTRLKSILETELMLRKSCAPPKKLGRKSLKNYQKKQLIKQTI